MCHCAHLYITSIQYDPKYKKGERNLTVADGNSAEVEGVGCLLLQLPSGFQLSLDEVLYVPSLKRNLISVSALTDSGHVCSFYKDKCVIQYNNISFGLAGGQVKLYILSLSDNTVMNVINV
jgi:hypothetical protein